MQKEKKVDFFIVGAMRSGTSSLRTVLSSHPHIFMVPSEPKYFSNPKRYKNIDEYHKLFDWSKKYKLRGEKSAPYGPSKIALDGIVEYNPNAKIIWLLRNPVKRAISHFYRAKNANPNAPSIKEAIDREDDLEAKRSQYAYIYRSRYERQINEWNKYFSQENMFIGIFEDVIEHPKKEINKVCNFLGLKNLCDHSAFLPSNISRSTKKGISKFPIPDEHIIALSECLEPSIYAMENILGRSLDCWRK